MLISLAQWLQTLSPEFGFFRVFQYLTFRAVMAAVTALLIGLIVGPKAIRMLTALKIGKQVALGFNAAQSNQIVDMRMCPLLLPELFALVAPVRTLLDAIAPQRRPVKVKLQMLDQGAEIIIEGVKANGLDAAMALQDFAGEHRLARLAIDGAIGAVLEGSAPVTNEARDSATGSINQLAAAIARAARSPSRCCGLL